MNSGRVIRVLSDRFTVQLADEVAVVKSRKKLKREVLPLVGDIVELENVGSEYVLSRIQPRISRIIRPPIANIEQIVIVLAPVPEAEFITIDKLLISAHREGIATVICVNKTDLAQNGYFEQICSQYVGIADYVISTCAAANDTEELLALLPGKITCFAGQSAVGKTSLVNAVCGVRREVGDMSEKTQRGKNTTTGVELLQLGQDAFVADTPGFAVLDLFDIEPADLHLYYSEYVALAGGCRYHMCTHTTEPDCAIRTAVECGSLNKKRYERYCLLLQELKEQKSHRKSWRNANEKK